MLTFKPGDLVKTRSLQPHSSWTYTRGDLPDTRMLQSTRDKHSDKLAGDQLVIIVTTLVISEQLRNAKPRPPWLASNSTHFIKVLDLATGRLGWVQDVALIH